MFKSLCSGVSTSIAFIIIVICSVLVVGLVAWQYLGMPKGEEEILEEKALEAPPEDETADWKVYRNEEYGYEIKYPERWVVHEVAGKKSISFVPENWEYTKPGLFRYYTERERIDIAVFEQTDLQEWLEEAREASTLTKKEIEIGTGNYKGEEFQGPFLIFPAEPGQEVDLRVIILIHNSFIYRIRIAKDDLTMSVFNQMLSTFRFLK